MKIDFHSHVLPEIDDGSRSLSESLKILDVMAEDGVDVVIATPHFYCSKTSIHRFLDKRNEAYEKLRSVMRPEHPKILLGAEVLYNSALVGKEALTRLAIQGTDYMLLEMPYTKLTQDIIDDVDKIACDFDVKVIIAHAERYLNFTSMKSLRSLLDLNVLGQINTTSLMKMNSRRNCFKLIEEGYIHVLGTDFHRIDRGDATIGEGCDILEKKFGKDIITDIEENSKLILSNSPIEDVLG